jgi:hypothetical protein
MAWRSPEAALSKGPPDQEAEPYCSTGIVLPNQDPCQILPTSWTLGRNMKKAVMSAMVATGAVALTVSLAPMAMADPQSDRSYYGTWELKAWNVDGTEITCPGTLPAPPPAPAIECKGGEFLKLTKGSRYRSNLSVFQSQKHPKGDFGILKLANSPTRTIVFYSDSTRADPRAYNLEMRKDAGGRDSMVISLEFSAGPERDTTIEMLFSRKAN